MCSFADVKTFVRSKDTKRADSLKDSVGSFRDKCVITITIMQSANDPYQRKFGVDGDEFGKVLHQLVVDTVFCI